MNKILLSSTVKLESAQEHPNKQPFKGILCSLDSASVKAPCGAEGKPVILTMVAAMKAIETLKGIPVNVVWDDPKGKFTGHRQTTVVGIVSSAYIQDSDVWIEGYLFPQNYPAICASVKEEKDNLGFSYEILANSYDDSGDQMVVNEFTFIGTALLYKDSAAYGNDTQLIAATINNEKDGNNMDKELFQGLIDAMLASIDGKITEIKASVESAVAAMEIKVEASVAEVAKANKQVEELAVGFAEIKASAAVAVEASAVIIAPVVAPAPTVLAVGQTVVGNADFAAPKEDHDAKLREINASAMNPLDKCKAIARLRAQA